MTMTMDPPITKDRDILAGPPEVAEGPLAITVDIDDVLYPGCKSYHLACVNAGITNGVTPRSYAPWEEYGCAKETWWDALAKAILDGTMLSLDPLPGAVAALWRLERAGHKINLATARATYPGLGVEATQAWRHQTEQWLYRHHIPFETLTYTMDKSVVPADFSVDDTLNNYDSLEAAGHRPYLVQQPWNDVPDTRRRVDHIAEFVAIVLKEDSA